MASKKEEKENEKDKEAAAEADSAAPKSETAGVKTPTLDPLDGGPQEGAAGNMDLLMDVSVPVVAQLGETEVRIKEILKLLPGSVIELDKLAGEPVEVLVRGQRFAQGEVVVVDENFGVRITKILTPGDRAADVAVA